MSTNICSVCVGVRWRSQWWVSVVSVVSEWTHVRWQAG